MNKNYKLLIVLFALMTLLFFSCASKQKTEDIVTKPEPAKTEEVQADTVKQEEPKAEPIKPKEDPLLAELKLLRSENGKVNKAKRRAVSLGADKAYADFFRFSEDLREKAEADASSGNLKGAIEKYNEAIVRYDTLSNLMEASSLRKEIDDNSFARFSPDDYVEAEKFSLNAIDHYNLDYKLAKEASEDALKFYKKVVNKGYLEFTNAAGAAAKEYKEDCDSIKVARSRKEEYNKAVRLFNKGKTAADRANYKEAYKIYTESANLFAKLYEEVSAKRAEAERAMAEAAKRQQESSNLALEADKEAPLTEAGEGFTDGELDLQNVSTPETGTPVETINTSDGENGGKSAKGQGGL